MTQQEILQKAEKIERRPNGDVYVTLPIGSLTAEEFSEIILAEVKNLQSAQENKTPRCHTLFRVS